MNRRLYLTLLLGLFFSLVCLYSNNHINAENTYLYPDNKEKNFISATEFFRTGNLRGYSQFKGADINLIQKLAYKDLKKFIRSKVNDNYYLNLNNIYINTNDNVSPNRQVYFYCSIIDNETTFMHKFIILDAETTEPLFEGNGQKFKELD